MTEREDWGEEHDPQLRISQEALQEFRDSVWELVANKATKTEKKAPQQGLFKKFHTKIDGERKIVQTVIFKELLPYWDSVTVELIDRNPIKGTKTHVFEEFHCGKFFGRLVFMYEQGVLTKRSNIFVNPQNFIEGEEKQEIIRQRQFEQQIRGEPIDEFQKVMSVLEQLKQEQQNKFKTRIKTIFRKQK